MLPLSSTRQQRGRRAICFAFLLLAAGGLSACTRAVSNAPAGDAGRLSKTVFAEKLGAYLVYAPLKAGRPSEFALHLTDLTEGTPVDKAEIALTAKSKGTQSATAVSAKAGETTGVYAAQVTLPKAGEYYVEIQIRHPKFSGRLTMTDFEVE